MTEPTKGAVGLTGFPTPDNAADIESYLLFYFLDPAWAQYILGACKTLEHPYNWFESGDMSPDEAAEAFRLIVNEAPYNLVPAAMGTPYWDDESGDDADDEEPTNDQEWYGQIVLIDGNLTWQENASIWIVTGMVAYAATPLAAIAFFPLARKFVIAWHNHDLGGIIRIFADANEIGHADTYSPTPSVGEMTVVMPEVAGFTAFDVPPVLWVEMSDEVNPAVEGEPNIQIIRKRLDEAEVTPTNLRYDSGTDTVQYSPDEGDTWVDDPADDPRVGNKFKKPLKTGADLQCRSAASMVKWLRDFVEYEAGIMTAGAEVTAVANAALFLFDVIAPWAILVQLLIDAAGTIFGIGATALTAAFAGDEWDTLLCILSCNIAGDGSVDEGAMTAIQDAISAQLNTTAALIVNLILQNQGIVGLQNAGTLYEVEDADCTDCFCGWCWDSNGATNLDEWTAGSSGGGTYNSGLGQWEGTNVGSGGYGTIYAVDREWSFGASAVVSSVAVRFGCTYNDGNRPTIILTLGGTQVGRVDSPYATGASQTDITFEATFADITCDKVRVYMASGTGCSVDEIVLKGQGDNPVGTNNC